MRAYVVPLNKMLTTGLRPLETFPGNGRALTFASNLRPFIGGLLSTERYTRSFVLNEDAQIFECAIGIFVLTSTTLYQYSSGELTALLSSLSVGEAWSCADFGEFIVFANGSVNLIRDPSNGEFYKDYGSYFPIAGTVARLRGRLILGDIRSGSDADESLVMWSDIGKASFNSSDNINLLRKGTAGSMPLYDIGKILSILPIAGSTAVVYGEEGIVTLTPSPQALAAGAMAKTTISQYGIASKRAASQAGKTAQYFISSYGSLHGVSLKESIHAKEGIPSIGELYYNEFIPSPSEALLSWDNKNKELIIGRPSASPFLPGESLIFGKYGMGNASTCIHSALYSRKNELIIHTAKFVKQLDAMATSDIIDFDSPGIKTIGQVEVRGSFPDGLYIAASFRVGKQDKFTNGDWRPVNQAGVAHLGVAGIEFKFHIACVDYTTLNIQSLAATVSYDDRRFRTGARTDYGNKDVAQPSE